MWEVFFHALPWETITPLTVLAAFSALVWSGRLIPRGWVEKRAADQAAQITHLHATIAHQEATIASLTRQIHELSVTGELSVALLRSLQQMSLDGGRSANRLTIRPPQGSGRNADVAQAIDEA